MAVIQSTATGDFNAGGTWVGGVAPGSGDTFEVMTGHTVTVTANASVLGWTQKGSGRIMLNAGVVLTSSTGGLIEGDGNDVAKVVLAAGAQLLANPGTGETAAFKIGGDYFRYAEIESRGNSGSRCKIGKTPGALGTVNIGHGDGFIWSYGLLDCEYTDLIGLGTIELYPRHHGKMIFKNCTVSGFLKSQFYDFNPGEYTGVFTMEDSDFTGELDLVGSGNASPLTIKRCEFFANVSLNRGASAGSDLIFHDSVVRKMLGGSWESDVIDIKGLFLYQRSGDGSSGQYSLIGRYVDCYAFADYRDAADQVNGGNPHFWSVAGTGKTTRVEGCVIEYQGPNGPDTGDALDLHSGTAEIVRTILLPSNTASNLSGFASGAFWFLGGDGLLDLDHCTIYSPNNAGGVRFPHSAGMTAGRARVRNCLFWTDHRDLEAYAIYNDSPGTSDVDALPPANCVGNAFVGMSNGLNVVGGVADTPINGIFGAEFSAAPTGNTVLPVTAPQFTDPIAGLIKWGRIRGISGDIDAVREGALAQIRADKTLVRTSLIPYVRSSMTPGNAALSGIAADGTTPGVAEVATALTWTAWPESLTAWLAKVEPKAILRAQEMIDLAALRQGGGGDSNAVGAVYYDGMRVNENLAAEFPSNVTLFRNAAVAAAYLYIDDYLIPGGYGAPGHWNFTTGLKMMFDRTSTVKYKDAVLGLSLNAAFAQDFAASMNGSIDGVRENGYAIMSHINARKLGQAERPVTAVRIADLWAQAQKVVDGVLTQPGDGFSTFGGGTLQTFMVAIMAETFKMLYAESTDVEERGDIVAMVQAIADYTWDDRWRPQSGLFWYGVDDSQDLNLYIAPMYAWLWHKTGNVRNRDRFDVIFSHGVNGGWLDPHKQFNQQNIKIWEGIDYRQMAVNTSNEIGEEEPDPDVVTGYALTRNGATTGLIGVATGNLTVELGAGTVITPILVTYAVSGVTGSFSAPTRTLTDSTRSGAVTFTPTSAGTATFSVTNNAGLPNPAPVTYEVTAPVDTSNPLIPIESGATEYPIIMHGNRVTFIIPWDGKL